MMLKKSEGGETIFSIFFYGSLWGIGEAPLGYLLHFLELTPGISGGIMFPVAFNFLRKAFLDTGRLFHRIPRFRPAIGVLALTAALSIEQTLLRL